MKSKLQTILLSGLIAGTFDMLAAILIYVLILQTATTQLMLEMIASGVFKHNIFAGNWAMAVYGLIFHYGIALAFAAFYFFIYPCIQWLHQNKIVSGLLYGIFVWMVMNLIVLNLVFPNRTQPSLTDSLIAVAILMVAVGLPISMVTARHYSGSR